MHRREFLQLSFAGGTALGVWPGWAAQAMAFPPELRVDYLEDGRWVDASRLPGAGSSFASSDALVTVTGVPASQLAGLQSASIELAFPSTRVVAWAHRGGAVPSTGSASSQRVPLDPASGLGLYVSAGREARRVALRLDQEPGPRLRAGSYRVSAECVNWFIDVEET